MITVGREFKSKWFDATAIILSADVDKNECEVKLRRNNDSWVERWNYLHTKLGFKNGSYFYLEKNKL